MKRRRALRGFIRGERALIIALALIYAVLALIYFLYNIPMEAVGYAIVISLIPILVMEAVRYSHYRKRVSDIALIARHITARASELPAPDGLMEKEYQAIILELDALGRSIRTQRDVEMSERMDYFTLWAHQIKTPIAAMRLLLQSQQAADSGEMSAQLFLIEQYVELALSYQRLDSGMKDLVLKSYPLDEIVKKALKKYARLFILKKLTLRYEPVNVSVLTDEKWLCFVIEQILSNAIKYTKQGGVLIEMAGENTLAIRDTGIGVSAEDLPRICERGYTGYNGRADSKSTGIGLYLCKRVMDRLGHGLRFESQAGHGMSVYLLLGRRDLPVE